MLELFKGIILVVSDEGDFVVFDEFEGESSARCRGGRSTCDIGSTTTEVEDDWVFLSALELGNLGTKS